MEKFDIFRDIAERTGGDIYIGVVGPVRTGKSIFIKKFMDLLVLPNIKDINVKERTKDELPQSGGGRTIMTTEPKFVPDEAVEIKVREGIKFKVRLVDCVGYAVDGALGYEDENGPRMVITPWFENPISFQDAAEAGTRKVVSEHSTIGLVITTDGTIADIPRDNYVEAEERVISELKEIGKPFVVILNSTNPESRTVKELASNLSGKYGVPVLPVDCAELSQDDIGTIIQEVLYEFPVKEVGIKIPKWVDELDGRHWLRRKFEDAVNEVMENIKKLRDVYYSIEELNVHDFIDSVTLESMNLGTGEAVVDVTADNSLFYRVLAEVCGFTVEGEHHLLRIVKEYSHAKKEYDKIAEALNDVRQIGYGIVPPSLEDMVFDEPELIRQGNRFGVKLRASAPSIHMVRADIKAEVSPVVGTERQCEETVRYLLDEYEKDHSRIWRSEFLGKSLNDLVREAIQNKLFRMPENAQLKLQETLEKIVNEGSGGLICIIL